MVSDPGVGTVFLLCGFVDLFLFLNKLFRSFLLLKKEHKFKTSYI
jgi:hypothetical protein